MSNLDGRLRLNVLLDSPPLSASGFTLPLLVSPDVEFPNGERIRVYNTAREVAEDPTVGEATRTLVSQAFSQNPKPAQIAIGSFVAGGGGGGGYTEIRLVPEGSSLRNVVSFQAAPGTMIEPGERVSIVINTGAGPDEITYTNTSGTSEPISSAFDFFETELLSIGGGLKASSNRRGLGSFDVFVFEFIGVTDPEQIAQMFTFTAEVGPDNDVAGFAALPPVQTYSGEMLPSGSTYQLVGDNYGGQAGVLTFPGQTVATIFEYLYENLTNIGGVASASRTDDSLGVRAVWSDDNPGIKDNSFTSEGESSPFFITDGAGGGGASESITDTLDAMLATGVDWFGFSVLIFGAGQELRDQTIEAAQWAEANDKLFGNTLLVWGAEDPIFTLGNTDNALSDLAPYENTYTVVEHIEEGVGFPSFLGFQLLANRLSVNPDSPNGATIWSYVTLAGATPSPFTASQLAAVREKNGNVYSRFFGQPATGWGVQGNGQKTDLVVLKHWLKARSEESIAGLLLRESNRGSKIPYTDAGIVQIKSKVEEVLALAVANGHLTGGTTWTNFLTVAETPMPDRQNRVIRFTFGGVPTGAIEEVEATGYISFDEQSGVSVEV